MKRLLIVGAGGFGREVLSWITDIPQAARDWALGGFLCDYPSDLVNYACDVPIVGGIQDYQPRDDDLLALAIGLPRPRMEIAAKLLARGSRFVTIVHPSATIGQRVELGRGTIVCPHAVITTDIKIGEFVIINVQAVVGHDAVVGDFCTIGPHACITGFATLGRGVSLGSHASVLPRAEVGDLATVGAGSVVLKRVKPGATVMGVPAKVILGGAAPEANE